MFVYYGLLVLINALRTFESLEPLPDELSSRLSLAKCVGELSDKYFGQGEVLVVSLPVNEVLSTQASAILLDRLLFSELFIRSRLSIIIRKTTNLNQVENYIKAIDNYIIQVRRLPELKQNLLGLQGSSAWNPHARFVIVSVTIYESTTDAASIIIEQLWNEKIANGVVLLPHPKNSSIFEAFTWFPFSNGHCGDGFEELHILDSCAFGKFEKGANWFPNKIPTKLNECPIRVRTVVWPPYVISPKKKETLNKFSDGLEILIMNTMAQMANFKVVYTLSDKVQDWGSLSSNGTATGALLYLKNEQSDVAVSSFAATVETHTYFDSIIYSFPEALHWCVPHAINIPEWENFIVILSLEIWSSIVVLYVIVSLSLWFVGLFAYNQTRSYKTLADCFVNSFAVLLGLSVSNQPKTIALRTIFVLWAVVSLHFTALYQTALISAFALPKYEKQISDFSDIIESKLGMWFLSTARRYFTNTDDWISIKVLENWRDCKDIAICLEQTAFDRDSVMCTPRLYMKFIRNHYQSSDGEPLLYCFENSIVTFPLEMLLRKGFPLKNLFTGLVGRITSSGLITHWEKLIFKSEFKDSGNINTGEEVDTSTLGITMEHMLFLIFLLFIGYVLGFVVLIIERRYFKSTLKIKSG